MGDLSLENVGPFTPGMGDRPPLLAGRDELVATMRRTMAIASQGKRARALLLVGPRGPVSHCTS